MSAAYNITTEHIDYLQRARDEDHPGALPTAAAHLAPAAQCRWWHITQVGQLEKRPAPVEANKPRLPSEDLLTGLYGARVPVAFLVSGTPSQMAVQLGTWSPVSSERGQTNAAILQAGLQSLYPSIAASLSQPAFATLPTSGLALGIPTVKPPDPVDGAVAMDRLIRAMARTNWTCLIIACPEEEQAITRVRFGVVDELREAQAALRRFADEQVVKHYTELLTVMLTTLTGGLAVGMWRTTVFLLGDAASYPRLASLWRGIFSGDESLPEPVRVWEREGGARLVTNWSVPDAQGKAGPGRYQHPFEYQTLLTSKQLSAYIHLPQVETVGFAVQAVGDFDAMPPPLAGEAAVQLGEIILRSQPTGASYALRRRDLTRHSFVAGVTGAGKTNTIFHLLKQLDPDREPFLVLEPAKREYRALLSHPGLGSKLHIFTLGDERVSPFRLNPFEVVGWPNTSVGVHLDLLRSVFAASFGMWTPLPQILEQCLHGVYEERGWDITANTNYRLQAGAVDPSPAFPTLSDLAIKVDEVTQALGYEDRLTADMRAALMTRINSLKTGGKGRMLNVRRSLPMNVLLEHPTVLELEAMGDDDDKAFIMGLLFVRLVEYRRAMGPSQELQHLLVIEEAHRLLTNVGERREEEGNARGKAVETFANLLSEIRAYGQGVLVADQVPVKLAPDVIKNTNLKIAHRIVAADDRAALAGAMAMNERQAHVLATLGRGEAAVFSEGDDAPVVVEVPPGLRQHQPGNQAADTTQSVSAAPQDDQVQRHMAESPVLKRHRLLFLPFPAYAELSLAVGRATTVAERIMEDPAFGRAMTRLLLSAMEATEAVDRLWPEVLALVRPHRPPNVDETDLLRCLAIHAAEWYAQRRGAQAGWTYAQTGELAGRIRRMLLAQVSEVPSEPARSEFRQHARQLHLRQFDPFPSCSHICKQEPRVCLYRYAAADLIASGEHRADWQAAEAEDVVGADGRRRLTARVSMEAGIGVIEFAAVDGSLAQQEEANAAARRAGLCFAQQILARDPSRPPWRVVKILDALLEEVRHD